MGQPSANTGLNWRSYDCGCGRKIEKQAVTFTMKTRGAIYSVGEMVAQDLPRGDAQDGAIVAELALDAYRLESFGYPQAQEEVVGLIRQHGWNAVRDAAARIVPTA